MYFLMVVTWRKTVGAKTVTKKKLKECHIATKIKQANYFYIQQSIRDIY